MKKLFLFLVIIILAVSYNSCSVDDGPNFRIAALQITDAEFPDAFKKDSTYTIKVKYIRPDSCTFFEGFEVVREADTIRNVAVIGSIMTDSNDCREIAEELETSFEFKVLYSDTYLFKFLTGNNQDGEAQYLEIEVPVN